MRRAWRQRSRRRLLVRRHSRRARIELRDLCPTRSMRHRRFCAAARFRRASIFREERRRPTPWTFRPSPGPRRGPKLRRRRRCVPRARSLAQTSSPMARTAWLRAEAKRNVCCTAVSSMRCCSICRPARQTIGKARRGAFFRRAAAFWTKTGERRWRSRRSRFSPTRVSRRSLAQTSTPEVDIVATLENGAVVSGRIDRLAETATEALIAEFKTGRPRAKLEDAHLRQLALYRAAVAPLFPGKRIRCFLIYTQNASVLEADESALAERARNARWRKMWRRQARRARG